MPEKTQCRVVKIGHDYRLGLRYSGRIHSQRSVVKSKNNFIATAASIRPKLRTVLSSNE